MSIPPAPAPTNDLFALLARLPGSYAGPTRAEEGPYAIVGVGEATLAVQLVETLVAVNFTRTGTQFVLDSADAGDAARTFAELAEVAGAKVRRVSTGGSASEIDVLVPGGPLATYHFAQFLAHATGHGDQAQAADALLTDLAYRCAPGVEQDNPARDLAWSLWGRTPLLLAAPDAEALPQAWQTLLARIGKTLSIPVMGDPLPFVTGAFEAQHEKGDGKIALILGDADPALLVAREILESRIDEVVHVPYFQEEVGGYAAQLGLWYFGAWVAAYLAERYEQSPNDLPILRRAQAVLSGEAAEDTLNAPREDVVRRTPIIKDWRDDGESNSDDLDDGEDFDEEDFDEDTDEDDQD